MPNVARLQVAVDLQTDTQHRAGTLVVHRDGDLPSGSITLEGLIKCVHPPRQIDELQPAVRPLVRGGIHEGRKGASIIRYDVRVCCGLIGRLYLFARQRSRLQKESTSR